ncbi:MAG: DUF87 domain-containing protein [Bacilli bacterium]|nr:DUF87 domain-containing protein [Bacilli bacterium]
MKKSNSNLNNKYKDFLLKFKDKLNRKENKKKELKKRLKNAKIFNNVDSILDNGIIKLKSNEFAKIMSVEAIDLSLSSNNQKISFFSQLKFLFQIKNLDLRIYKLDDKLDFNSNKEYYNKLIDKYKADELKSYFLKERYSRYINLEYEKLTTTSRYYFCIISKSEKLLQHQVEEVEMQCYNLIPRLNIKQINNKLEIYQFLINFYFSESNLEQIIYYDLPDLITPYYIRENINSITFDDKLVQFVVIKNLPLFIDDLFLEELFNVPNARCCIHIKDTIPTDEIVRRLDSNYEMLLSDRMTTRKLSDATEMDTEKENFRELMNQIKNGDEKLKEVDFIVALVGTKQELSEKIRYMKKLGDMRQIKIDVPYIRQAECFSCFDLTSKILDDYKMYLPTLTLASSFPLTITNFNDNTGYLLGVDKHTALPINFDMFYKDKTRPSSNLAVIASTGGGKSFTLKKLIVNEINRGNKVFIFDAEEEYKKLVLKNNGQYIDLYSNNSNSGIINPLQVRYLPSDLEELEDNSINNIEDCPLAKHLSSLETFIKCAFEDIKEKEIVVMLDMIEKLYQRFGITKNTEISKLERLKATDYPIFTDLINFLSEYRQMLSNDEKIKIVDSIEILLERFKVGTDAMLFNGYTTVDLNADLIAFNVKNLLYSKNKRIITTQLVNLLTYLNNIIVSNKIINDKRGANDIIKSLSIAVDEFHLYLKNIDSDVMLAFEQIARRIRKYYGNFIPATQSIRDFIGDSEAIRSATAIFNNCQYQLVGMLQDDDLKTYLNLFYQNPLTDSQKDFLSKAEQGEFLLTVNSKIRLALKVLISETELDYMGEE